MKTPVTVRIEAGLLATVRRCAAQENRTLTNFIETVLRRRVEEMAIEGSAGRRRSPRHIEDGPDNAA